MRGWKDRTSWGLVPVLALVSQVAAAEGPGSAVEDEVERATLAVARAHRAPRRPRLSVRKEFTPAAYNDPATTARLEALFVELLGKDRVSTHEPSTGGEDFGRYARTLKIPGVMYKLGAARARRFRKTGGQGLPGLHSDKWAPDAEPTLRTGILTMSTALLDALQAHVRTGD